MSGHAVELHDVDEGGGLDERRAIVPAGAADRGVSGVEFGWPLCVRSGSVWSWARA
jgi:hypothetical protein